MKQENGSPFVSIVVVSWNVRSFLVRTVESILDTIRRHSFEVVVVDNDSSDDSVEVVQSRFPDVRLIRNEKNRGFAAACNQGARSAAGRFLLFLNPDAELRPGCLDYLLDQIAGDSSIGIITARVDWPDGRIQKTCGRRHWTFQRLLSDCWGISKLAVESEHWGGVFLPQRFYLQRREVESLSGAFMLVREEAFWSIAGFDQEFCFGAEDMDLCRRMRNVGWKLIYDPAVRVMHRGGRSRSQNREFAEREDLIGIFRYFEKHHPQIPLGSLSLIFLIRSLLLSIPSLFRDLVNPGDGLVLARMRSCCFHFRILFRLLNGSVHNWRSFAFLARGETRPVGES